MLNTITDWNTQLIDEYYEHELRQEKEDKMAELGLDHQMHYVFYQVATLIKQMYDKDVTWSDELHVGVNEYQLALSYTFDLNTSDIAFHLKVSDSLNHYETLIEKELPVGQDVSFSRIEAPVTACLNMMI